MPNDEAMSTVLQPCTSSLAPSPTSMVSCEDIFGASEKPPNFFFQKTKKMSSDMKVAEPSSLARLLSSDQCLRVQLLLVLVSCLWLPGAGEGAEGAPSQGECRPPDRIAIRAVLPRPPA